MASKKSWFKPSSSQVPLPEELITIDILPRLPVKSLLRFKSVSKNWNTLIASRDFAKLHFANQHNINKPFFHIVLQERITPRHNTETLLGTLKIEHSQLLLCDHKQKKNVLRLRGIKEHYDNTNNIRDLIGSCNGLVLSSCDPSEPTTNFVLWNPALGKDHYIQGPHCPHFEASDSGFGYDPSSNDYKVLLLGELNDLPKGYILTLRNGRWRQLNMNGFQAPNGRKLPPVFVGQSLHWPSGIICEVHNKILAFDLVKEEFYDIALPIPDGRNGCRDVFVGLSEIRQSLCAYWFIYKSGERTYDMEVWMLEHYGDWKSWKRFFTFNDCHVTRFSSVADIPMILQLFDVGDESGRVIVLNLNTQKLVLVDPSASDETDKLRVQLTNVSQGEIALRYTESLVWPQFSCKPATKRVKKS